MKKVWYMLGAFMIMFLLQVHSVNAQEILEEDPQQGTSMSNEEVPEEQNGISLFSMDADPYTGLVYTHNHPNAESGVVYGIDVSYYNGSIDWNAVKRAGIENVMVRVGYRGYGTSGTLNEDPRFRENIEGALDAGLNVGVYIFSQAITRQEASDEADFIINRIRDYNITLPVVIDFEYASTGSGMGGRLYNANLSVDQATNVCKAFCRIVEEEGYTAMVYANKSMLTDHLNASELSSRYKIWLANYTTSTSYSGRYDVWQYSSGGNVDGISGSVDCNFWYQESDTVYQGIDYSSVYNYEYYTSTYADVRNAFGDNRQDTLEHFVEFGMLEGRQGCEDFNVTTYRNRYADLRQAFGSDLKKYYMHYIEFGKAEGRSGRGTVAAVPEPTLTVYNGVDYSAVYDFDYYTGHYADIKSAFGNSEYEALKHFVEFGMSEGRQGCADFNATTYRNRYADLRQAFGNDLRKYYMHYIEFGKAEGRSGSGTAEAAPEPTLTVYNGVDYSAVYDFNYYTGYYADIKSAFGNSEYEALKHFVEFGMSEGRQGCEDFNVTTYRNRYADLRQAFGSDLRKYYMHYIEFGKAEGRSGSGTAEAAPEPTLTVYNGVDYSAVYDFNYYTGYYADIKSAFGNSEYEALKHFVEFGMSEGRQGCEDFNVTTYRNRYADLRQAFESDLRKYYMHYIEFGKAEGRVGAEISQTRTLSLSPCVVYEGVDYGAVFDFEYYTSHYTDIRRAFGNDKYAALEHFVEFGISEGRQGNEDFDVNYYRSHNGDLEKEFGDDLTSYYLHYLNYGKNEGRLGHQEDEEEIQVLNQEVVEEEEESDVMENQEITENSEMSGMVPEDLQNQNDNDIEVTAPNESTGENNIDYDTASDYNNSEADKDEDTENNAEEVDVEIIESDEDGFLTEESQQSDKVESDTEGAGAQPAPSVVQIVR